MPIREISKPIIREICRTDDQPPLIPHSIQGYEVSLNANKCMSCHARRFTEQSQAPMISVTHYQDREGNTLGGLAPRRYACLACHVPQTTAQPLIASRSSTWMLWRCRNSTTRIARPMADSAAATVRMKNTNTWPCMSPR